MKRPAHEITIETLKKNGWEYDHEATAYGYRPAGTVTPMQARDGFQLVRVHHGKTVTKGLYGYQVTTVLRKPL